MWGVNPHKTVPAQARRECAEGFWFCYLIFYGKKKTNHAALQMWNYHFN